MINKLLFDARYYNGNKNLKAAGVQEEFTKEEISEYVKCFKSPVYFIEKYIKVTNLDKGIVPFVMYPYQKRIIEAVHNNRFTICMLFRQAGKALPLDTLIPTPRGFIPIKNIHPSDKVFGSDGCICNVVLESQIQDLEMYNISFSDGENIIACKDHQWKINDSLKKDPEVVTTEFLAKNKLTYDGDYRFSITNCKPVQYKSRFGNIRADELIDRIPLKYLETDTKQRFLVLDRLVSMYGVVIKRTNTIITLPRDKEQLSNDIFQLVSSLGFSPARIENPTNTITIAFNVNPKEQKRYIVGIKKIPGLIKGKCLQVDSEDHTYLVGRQYLPTHNSTVLAAYALWHCMFNDNKCACILANKQKQAQEIFNRSQTMFENLPRFLQQGVKEWNKLRFTLENGSTFFAAASSASAVRGRSISFLIADEFAFLPSGVAEEFISSVFPTITSSETSKLVLISTPNGIGNPFYKYWKEAEEGTNGFVAVQGKYTEIHDEKWAQAQLDLLGPVRYNGEVLCQFQGSSQTLIESKKLLNIPFKSPIAMSINNTLHFFEQPIKDHIYVMTVDVSRGRGLDFSAFVVYDVTSLPYKVVVTFKNNMINTLEFPNIINQVAIQYNEASVLIENNDLGEDVANTLWNELEYMGIIWTKGEKISTSSGTIGVRTTATVKRKGCSAFKEIIEHDQIIINDFRIIEELGIYVANGRGSYEAQDHNVNDDLMSCFFLFGWLTNQNYFKGLTDTDVSKAIQEEYRQSISDEIVPFLNSSSNDDVEIKYEKMTDDQKELLVS